MPGEENLEYMEMREVRTKGSRRQPSLTTCAWSWEPEAGRERAVQDLMAKGKVKRSGEFPERSMWR